MSLQENVKLELENDLGKCLANVINDNAWLGRFFRVSSLTLTGNSRNPLLIAV